LQEAFQIAALWLGLAVLSTIIAGHLRISMALVEICVGMMAAFVANWWVGPDALRANQDWLRFIASIGAVLLTFLASWLAGIALSTTSMAVVYAVMLETGFNKTDFGKGILGACFINDLGTVIALGVLFAPFTFRTVIFLVVTVLVLGLLPFLTGRLTSWYGNRTAAIRTKWILFVLCGLGALALWSGSEAVLPAYLAGMVLAKNVGRDNFLHSPAADFDDRLFDAFLFLAGRHPRIVARAGVGPLGASDFVGRQSSLENLRALSGHWDIPSRYQGALVLHPFDVDGAYFRHHFGFVWSDP
jgi:Kef-type K+ transport system membrane component KefB